MEHQLWKEILIVLARIRKPRRRRNEMFTTEEIIKIWLWAVLHDRPVSWACVAHNWPVYLRRVKRPSPSTMSRRLRSEEVRQGMKQIEQRVCMPRGSQPMVWVIDGKPLPIGGCSKDRQAGYGRAAGCKAKGYKIHALVSLEGSLAAWRVAPMNKDERVIARRLLRDTVVQGYVLADSNYDSNPLHEVCVRRGNLQLVVPPRRGYGTGRGHCRQSVGRLRSIAMLESPQSSFGRELHECRDNIERFYARLSNWGGGLTHLPPWARTHRRVHRWVQAKFIFTALRKLISQRTYVA